MGLKDPANATNVALAAGPAVVASVIGLDTARIYDALPNGLAAGANVVTTRIGGATQNLADARTGANFDGKALQFKAITTLTANDALINGVAGWYNRSGQSAAVGKYVLAVAA